MGDISKLVTPDGTSYNIKDTTARSKLAEIQYSLKQFGATISFTAKMNQISSTLATKLAALQDELETNEMVTVERLYIQDIGYLKPDKLCVFGSSGTIPTVDWQWSKYSSDKLQFFSLADMKKVELSMLNSTNTDGYYDMSSDTTNLSVILYYNLYTK